MIKDIKIDPPTTEVNGVEVPTYQHTMSHIMYLTRYIDTIGTYSKIAMVLGSIGVILGLVNLVLTITLLR